MIAGSDNTAGGRQNGHSDRDADERSADERAAVETIGAVLNELRGYAAHYLAAQRELLRYRLRMLLLGLIVAVAGGITLVVLLATATVQLLSGLAGAAASAMESPRWAGQLVSAGAVAIGLVSVLSVIWVYQRKASYRKAVVSYEHRREHERAAYGRDAPQRAAATARTAS
jgi:hypothetical protein